MNDKPNITIARVNDLFITIEKDNVELDICAEQVQLSQSEVRDLILILEEALKLMEANRTT